VAVLTRHLVRPGVGGDKNLAGVEHRPCRGQEHVRPDVARDEVDIVLVDELVGLLLADFGLESVVLEDHPDIEIAHPAAHVFDREFDRILHVVADHRGRRGERRDETDLHLLGKCNAERLDAKAASGTGQGCPDHRAVPP
jgi:hypothetical protein